ncbi:MAG: ATPase superfamily [Bryobacterales bacterium]|nr:ATPase superfamily [Bryobacterales bacterium]
MAQTNHDRVGKTLEYLREGLKPFVERELKNQHAQRWFDEFRSSAPPQQMSLMGTEKDPNWDVHVILACMWDQWNTVFQRTLGRGERSNVSELRDVRNKWAHQNPFSSDDTYRALDTASRLLLAVSAASQANEVEKMKAELLRLRFDEQTRSEKRKSAGATIESQATGTLKPWREVVQPHPDVASGRYQTAEFAADLWQVHFGEGSNEYKDPREFFRRTYLTESLSRLLTDAVGRLTNNSGDPVVQLQTNFGGGKTHSMLALYHLFSGAKPGDMLGIDKVLTAAKAEKLPQKVQRVVLVGNKISPGNPSKKSDGTFVCTLWGELAWQLGGRPAFERIRLDDERATNPGDALREILNQYGPAVILIDEWVAYARQLHDNGDLPGGTFETQFSFAQALTESVKLAKNCLLVVSLPASDANSNASPHTHVDEIEVGGQRGREALERLRNVIGRVESSWRPASAEEGFEIVRRRLFEPMVDPDQFKHRDVIADAFYNLYRTQKEEFPSECRTPDYEQRLRAAYPIHPEVFDRLYTDWSTLAKFQRTRGVLRLMASVIHTLWDRNDRNPLILPCNIPIDDQRVQFELTRYLPDNWVPVIEKDVDGPHALPLRIDGEIANLGKFQACRRIARTIYLGSAPIATAANRGIEDRSVKLGCVMPGESPAIFGDALRRLSGAATYLYGEGARYWYSTQPTVTKLAEDRAEQMRREPDKIAEELKKRVSVDAQKKGDFSRLHVFPQSGGEVQDDVDARLVILSPEQPYAKEADNLAETAAKQILAMRGSSPRLYQNSLAFLAADRAKYADLEEGVRKFLAWQSVVNEAENLNLSQHQKKQAEGQRNIAEDTMVSRIPEAYQWLLVPVQNKPTEPVVWQAGKVGSQDGLAARASKKLRGDELLFPVLGPTRLRMELDKIPLWNGNHVLLSNLFEHFGRYLYLPRLVNVGVLVDAIQRGIALLTWRAESFAYADSYDEQQKVYRGLITGQQISISTTGGSVLVRPEVAAEQRAKEAATAAAEQPTSEPWSLDFPSFDSTVNTNTSASPKPRALPKRFYGCVTLDSGRVGRDAGRIADEVLSHLSGLIGSDVKVTLEIEAQIPSGATDDVIRVVTENAKTLKFNTQGFEVE